MKRTQLVNIIIQARMGSTRLPGKILRPVMDRPLLSYLLERLNQVSSPHTLIIATTTNANDDVIEKFATNEGVLFFRGSEEDVLDRYYQTCCTYPADLIVRITSDCPLIDPSIIDQAIQLLQGNKTSLRYVSNTLERTFPRGMDVEAFTFDTLKTAAYNAISPYDREHVTPFIYNHPQLVQLTNFTHDTNLSQYRLTVDTAEDFLLITKIFENLYPKNKNFTLSDIIQAFEKNPEWKAINDHIIQRSENGKKTSI